MNFNFYYSLIYSKGKREPDEEQRVSIRLLGPDGWGSQAKPDTCQILELSSTVPVAVYKQCEDINRYGDSLATFSCVKGKI